MAPGPIRLALVTAMVVVAVAGASTPTIATGTPVESELRAGGPSHPPYLQFETGTATTESIGLVQELRLLPDRPGEISVRLTYTVPAGVESLQTQLPPKATVTGSRGFVRLSVEEYAWDRRTSGPELTYRLPANETIEATGPIAGRGDFAFVDTGEWALVRIPPTATSWTRTAGGPAEVSKEVTTAGDGAVGDAIAFLGDHREVRRTAHGQTFRLIVPSRAELATTEGDILDSVVAASDALQVGDRDSQVFMVAAPTGQVRWGVRGLQLGASSFWVRDSERLDTADNVWLHEYVHTRQAYAARPDTSWFTEASASYYAALLTLEQSRIGFDAFWDRLAVGAERPVADTVLADPRTWNDIAPYLKGALVAGELDRRLRVATNRSGTLQDVFYRMNRHDGNVTVMEFREMVRVVGGMAIADLVTQYTTTQDVPEMWGLTAHDRAFDDLPARISYGVLGPNGSFSYRVRGPYRNVTFNADRQHLAVGESLSFEVRVENLGGSGGEYDVQMLVDGSIQGRATGRLGPGETTTVRFTHRFTEPGEHVLTVGGSRLVVSVHEPAVPTVERLRLTPARVAPNSEVEAIASIRNDRPYPASADFTLFVNGVAVDTRHVTVSPSQTQTLTFVHGLSATGEHVFRVGDRTANVTVVSTPAPTTPASGQADGFGMGAALVALAVFLLWPRRRR